MRIPRKIAIGFQEGVCPLKCNKCLIFGRDAKKKKEVHKMSLEIAKRLIDEIAEMNPTPIIQPCISGEPFTNSDLQEIITYCSKYDVGMSIITNGILLNAQWRDFLLANTNRKCNISFSLDAITQETYEKVRGDYQLGFIENVIEELVRKREALGPRVTVNFTVEEDNESEAVAFIEKWKYKVDGVRVSVGVDSNRKIPQRYHHQGHVQIDKKCGFLDQTMVIDADGHVRACTYDIFGDTDFGSVFEKGILQIWNGEDMNRLRQLQQRGIFMDCDYCKGCEAGLGAMRKRSVSEDFIINEADYAIYYNKKNNYTFS